jgi:diguanylate cyclase (GGDEF)-like protein
LSNQDGDFDGKVLQPLLRAISEGEQLVALYDAEDRLRHANAAFYEIFLGNERRDLTFAESIRSSFHRGVGAKIDGGDVEAFLAYVDTRRRRVPQRAFEVDLLDGRWLWVTETLLEDGWLLMIGTDITALKHNERTLRKAHEDALHLSRTDPLTGLPNRRRILELVLEMLQALRENGLGFSLSVVDLDDFKRVNDTVGHQGGDRVLAHFAATCHARLPQGHSLGRFGGEEFLLLHPGCDSRDAACIVNGLRRYLGSIETPVPPILPKYTFSAGIADAVEWDDSESLIRRADGALYLAKGAGRDQVKISAKAVFADRRGA